MNEEALEKIVRRIYERRHGNINYVKLKGLVRRFIEHNSEADPEQIDWLAVYDDSLSYDELIQAFEEQYPMYRWRQEAPMEQRQYEDQVVNHIINQAEELSEESIRILINALQERIEAERSEQEAERLERAQQSGSVQETSPQTQLVEAKPSVSLTMIAKYPWLDEAKQFTKAFTFDSAPKQAYGRALERLSEALERGELGVVPKLQNTVAEILSFPIAKAVVVLVNDDWLKRRWSLAEAARVERLLHQEPKHVFDFLLARLGLKVERHDKEYRIRFTDYLRLARDLTADVSWKLVNQTMDKGWVYLSQKRLIRLVRQYLYAGLYESFANAPKPTKIPPAMEEIASEVIRKLQDIKAKQKSVKPSGKMPPCIQAIGQRLADASHTENFVYAAYHVNKGVSVDEVVQMFSVRSDFRQDIARYQVEHIAGLRGSRVKYRPPSCARMKELGLCVDNGKHCPRNIRNPLDY